MKYAVILGDGMADTPVPELGGKTPLEAANKPNIDKLARYGELGMVKTVPDHLNPPGSDIANMSVMGYDPDIFYTGRSPLEAVSMGITMSETDLALRCNVVTLSDEANYEDKSMVDYSAGEISTPEARELINYMQEVFGNEIMHLYPGVSYRHCLIMNKPETPDMKFTPPHDISGKPIKEHLPKGTDADILLAMMKKSYDLLMAHPVNRARIAAGKNPANSLWFWGEGRKPGLADFKEVNGLNGCVVSAVDLVKGLGLCAGMEVPDVPNVTGTIDTNFEGKCDAAIDFLQKGGDFVYIHMEAPDECGHHGDIEGKVKSIELIDEKVVGPLVEALGKMGDYRILVMPDHPTPIAVKTHTHNPIPYLIYDSAKKAEEKDRRYTEKDAETTGIYIDPGYTLMKKFLG